MPRAAWHPCADRPGDDGAAGVAARAAQAGLRGEPPPRRFSGQRVA